jgi:hypothetical protein
MQLLISDKPSIKKKEKCVFQPFSPQQNPLFYGVGDSMRLVRLISYDSQTGDA